MDRKSASGVAARITALVVCALALCIAATPAGAKDANDLLKNRPFAPTVRGLFSQQAYPDTPEDVPAQGTALSEAQARAKLKSYLEVEYQNDAAARNAALAVYDKAKAKQKIPDPFLRAAFAALKGSFAEGAINVFLNAETSEGDPLFVGARVGGLPITVLARSSLYAGTGPASDQFQIIFNSRYRYESPFLFTHIWAHEVLHQDRVGGIIEEAVAHSLDQLVYLRQLSKHPELARSRTQLSRVLNYWVLPRLNSGRGSRLGLYSSNGSRRVIPGSPNYQQTNWWKWFQVAFFDGSSATQSNPGNALLGQYLSKTHTRGTPRCSGSKFSKGLLNCIDENGNDGLGSSKLVAAARALKLDLGN